MKAELNPKRSFGFARALRNGYGHARAGDIADVISLALIWLFGSAGRKSARHLSAQLPTVLRASPVALESSTAAAPRKAGAPLYECDLRDIGRKPAGWR